MEYEEDDFCPSCGSSTEWVDCWKCGGEGGRGYEDDLQFEDPLWYSPGDFVTCDECHGKEGYYQCLSCKEIIETQNTETDPGRSIH